MASCATSPDEPHEFVLPEDVEQITADTLREVLGDRAPRIACIPAADDYSMGFAVLAIAKLAGYKLDDWQQLAILLIFARRNGKWAAFKVGIVCPRQNGKNGILEPVQIGGLIATEDRLQVHTAHRGETSDEAFERLESVLTESPQLMARIGERGFKYTNGKTGIKTRRGCRLKFRTRTPGGGRGLSGDRVFIDEGFNCPEAVINSLFPLLAARPNAQIIFTSSAVDQTQPGHEHGLVLARLREEGIAGAADPIAAAAGRTLYLEWSVDEDEYRRNPRIADDPRYWSMSNPAHRLRISDEYIAEERKTLSDSGFATERLGVGNWPDTKGGEQVIAARHIAATTDEQSQVSGGVVFAVDTKPDRSASAISLAGWTADGRKHFEVVDHRPGTGWVAKRIVRLVWKWQTLAGVQIDARSAAASLIPDIHKAAEELSEQIGEDVEIDIDLVTGGQLTEWCGLFEDAFTGGAREGEAGGTGGGVEDDEDDDAEPNRTIVHLGQREFTAALRAAKKRELLGAWAWDKKGSGDISVLVSGTLAVGRLHTLGEPSEWLTEGEALPVLDDDGHLIEPDDDEREELGDDWDDDDWD